MIALTAIIVSFRKTERTETIQVSIELKSFSDTILFSKVYTDKSLKKMYSFTLVKSNDIGAESKSYFMWNGNFLGTVYGVYDKKFLIKIRKNLESQIVRLQHSREKAEALK